MSKFIPRCSIKNHVYSGLFYYRPYVNNNSKCFAPLALESGGLFSRIVGFFKSARRFFSKPSVNYTRDRKATWQYEYEQFLDNAEYNHDDRK